MALNEAQKNLYRVMVMSGASKQEALVKVQGYGNKPIEFDNSLVCPSCKTLMNRVILFDKRKAKHCPMCRTCLPLPVFK